MQYSEDKLTYIAETHWKEFCPKMWARMAKGGTAQEDARKAAKRTLVGMEQLMTAGYTEDQAWEMMREDWILLKEEEEVEEEGYCPFQETMAILQQGRDETIAEEEGRA